MSDLFSRFANKALSGSMYSYIAFFANGGLQAWPGAGSASVDNESDRDEPATPHEVYLLAQAWKVGLNRQWHEPLL